MAPSSPFSGILLMNKPEGFTSHDVVAKLRGILRTRKIGHGGTLDPMATGVLPVFIGGTTRAADYAAAQEKEYVAGFTLGIETDTQDTTGTILRTAETRVSAAQVTAALAGFAGAQKQIPPMYSAVKIDGKKLYALARKGVEIVRPARDIFVHEISLLEFCEETQKGLLRTSVSKGTYVRTLVHDLGLTLGTFGAMHSLLRTRSGSYPLEDCLTFAQVQAHMEQDTLPSVLLPTDSLFLDYPRVDFTEYGMQRALNGAFIAPEHAAGMPLQPGTLCRCYYENTFIMLGQVDKLEKGGTALFVHKNFR